MALAEERRMERFIVGDALRGVGAVAVFTFHAAAAAAILLAGHGDVPTGNANAFLDAYGLALGSVILSGPVGFLVFFVLSGYLIGLPFVRSLVEDRPLPRLLPYARNRILRIVPAYWAALTALIVILAWISGEAELPLGEALRLYTFQLSADSPVWMAQAWSLAVEAKFYVVLPIVAIAVSPLVRKLPSPRARAIAIALPCLAWFVAASFVYDSRSPDGQPFLYFLRMLAVGVAIAALSSMIRSRVAGRARWGRIATASFAAAVTYTLAAGALYDLGSPFDGPVGSVAADIVVTGLVFAPLLRQWSVGGSWLILDNPVTRWLGVRSYSFYLVHAAVLIALGREMGRLELGYEVSFALLMTVGLAVSIAVAALLYRLVERPLLMRKQRPSRAKPDVAPSPVVAAAEQR